MSARSRAESAFLVFAILALFGLLILLIGSLDEFSLQPGQRLPGTMAADEEDPVPHQRVLSKLSPRDRLYASILGILTAISVVCVFIFRALRKQVLQYLFLLVSLILPLTLGLLFFGKLLSGWFQRQSGGAVDPAPPMPEAIIANPPTWSVVLTAGLIALLGIGALTFFALRWLAYRTYVEKKKVAQSVRKAAQQAVAEQAAAAASRIRQGHPVQGEVVRCYQEMDRLLSKRRHIKPTYLTAREFARSLNEAGIQAEPIRQLTELFELVRYGERDDRAMAHQALDCLDKLQHEYGRKENREVEG